MSNLWGPMREMMQLHARLGRALGDPLVRQWGAGPARREPAMPPLDVSETDEAFVIRVDLPGLRREEIEVALDAGTLSIGGEMPEHETDGGAVLIRGQRFRGPFRRVVPLPRQADTEAVRAALADGVLTVTVGKRASGRVDVD